MDEFEDVFNRLFTPLCIFANKYVNDKSLAKDIVQDVFVKVWEQQTLIKDKDHIDGFFYTSVRNKSLDFVRSKYAKDFKHYPDEELDNFQKENDFIKESIILDTTAIVQNAINKLPSKAAQVIQLSIQNVSNNDIAVKLEISVNTVKSHKQKVYKKFKELLSDLMVN
ncbi:MAG: sigma-70 family RNA polymerase sigma factor [Cellulophaga sp.]